MNLIPVTAPKSRGSSLMETVIAMGVLAVAIPLVFGALAESGKSGISSEAETRGTWMVPACMEEIQASRDGHPQFFTTTTVGQTFPPEGDVWALAFSPEGKPVAKISKALYDTGTKEIDGKPVRYIASLGSKSQTTTAGATAMLSMHISLEYPAASPAAKRQKLEFYTRIP